MTRLKSSEFFLNFEIPELSVSTTLTASGPGVKINFNSKAFLIGNKGPKGRFQKKKIVEFSTKGGGVRIGQFSTKKNNCLKHSKLPKKHFKTNLFFSLLGGVGGSFHQN